MCEILSVCTSSMVILIRSVICLGKVVNCFLLVLVQVVYVTNCSTDKYETWYIGGWYSIIAMHKDITFTFNLTLPSKDIKEENMF